MRQILFMSSVLLALAALLPGCPPSSGEGEGEGEPEFDGTVGQVNLYYDNDGPTSPKLTSTALFSRTRVVDVAPLRSLDTCTVIDYDLHLSPLFPLYPGTPGTITTGLQQAQLIPLPDPFGRPPFHFQQDPYWLQDVSPGDRLTIAFPAGPSLPAFSLTTVAAAPPSFTHPEMTAGDRMPYIVDIDFDSDLTLAWDASLPGDDLEVTLYVDTPSEPATTRRGCGCVVNDDGAFTVPASYLRQLHYDSGVDRYVFTATRRIVDSTAITDDAGAPAIVRATSSSSIYAYSAQ